MIMQITEENKEPALQLAGSNLSKNGFNIGDIVTVDYSDNKIVIAKIDSEQAQKFKQMAEENPVLLRLSKEFNLDFLVA